MSIKEELNARAKFKEGDTVYWHAVEYKVWVRYWRRSEDAFYYTLREIVRGKLPEMPKKVPESELETGEGEAREQCTAGKDLDTARDGWLYTDARDTRAQEWGNACSRLLQPVRHVLRYEASERLLGGV